MECYTTFKVKQNIKKLYSNTYAEWITDVFERNGGADIETEFCEDKEMINELKYRIEDYTLQHNSDWIGNDKELQQFKKWLKIFEG